jgi:hypothetical protein
MSTYPALNSMGIQNPKEIARYALYMVNNTDIQLIYESSAEFRNALSELNQLMDARSSSESLGNLIEEEIHALEEDVASRIAYIKSLVDKI